jgi:hypothetical protein
MTVSLPYATLRANYSSSDRRSPAYLSQADLFREIGWDTFIGNPNYENTCAIRVSLALVKSGHEVRPGSHLILAGPHKGKRLQVSMTKLANLLAQPQWFGSYEVLVGATLGSGLRTRQGIIAFHGIPGYSGGGHIDLIDNHATSLTCASSCYFGAREVWFWPLLNTSSR